jgi:hypothetical protein
MGNKLIYAITHNKAFDSLMEENDGIVKGNISIFSEKVPAKRNDEASLLLLRNYKRGKTQGS